VPWENAGIVQDGDFRCLNSWLVGPANQKVPFLSACRSSGQYCWEYSGNFCASISCIYKARSIATLYAMNSLTLAYNPSNTTQAIGSRMPRVWFRDMHHEGLFILRRRDLTYSGMGYPRRQFGEETGWPGTGVRETYSFNFGCEITQHSHETLNNVRSHWFNRSNFPPSPHLATHHLAVAHRAQKFI